MIPLHSLESYGPDLPGCFRHKWHRRILHSYLETVSLASEFIKVSILWILFICLSRPQKVSGACSDEFAISENHMLTSVFTYDITVEPIDPLMLMLSYSHVENYVRTLGASQAGGIRVPVIISLL